MDPSPASPGEASLDHPIFCESIRLIREALEPTGVYARWPDALERDVLERLVHSSGDLSLPADLVLLRSEERRVGKECRSRWSPYH